MLPIAASVRVVLRCCDPIMVRRHASCSRPLKPVSIAETVAQVPVGPDYPPGFFWVNEVPVPKATTPTINA